MEAVTDMYAVETKAATTQDELRAINTFSELTETAAGN